MKPRVVANQYSEVGYGGFDGAYSPPMERSSSPVVRFPCLCSRHAHLVLNVPDPPTDLEPKQVYSDNPLLLSHRCRSAKDQPKGREHEQVG